MHYLKDIECGLPSELRGTIDIGVLAKVIAMTPLVIFCSEN